MNKNYNFFIVLVLIASICYINPTISQSKTKQTIPEHSKYKLVSSSSLPNPFKVGYRFLPSTIDPHIIWNPSAWDIIDQVYETLFYFDYKSPNNTLKPLLASDYGTWSTDNLNYTVSLKQGIKFHDGSQLNATAVKWSFDRLLYCLNADGTNTNPNMRSQYDQIFYIYSKNNKAIIKDIEVVDKYKIRFVLNQPYSPFENLLAFHPCSILSPTSTSMTENITIKDNLVGTGPFIYDGYNQSKNTVNFHAYQDYWRSPAEISNLTFIYQNDEDFLHKSLLNGTIHFLDSPNDDYFEVYKDEPDLKFVDGGPGRLGQYLGLNAQHINLTMRKAMSHAINYSRSITSLFPNKTFERLKNVFQAGMQFYHPNLNYPKFNITKARQILIDANIAPQSWNVSVDTNWTNKARSSNPFANYNYTSVKEADNHHKLFYLLKEDLEFIGINCTEVNVSYLDWNNFLRYETNKLEIFPFGFGPAYNNPHYIFRQFFSNDTLNFSHDQCQLNDSIAYSWIIESLNATNDQERKDFCYDIQKRMVEELYPMAWIAVQKNYDVYISEVNDYSTNSMEKNYFYDILRDTDVKDYSISIDTCGNITYYENETGHNASWVLKANDLSNPKYFIFRDGIELENGTWSSSENISLSVDGLNNGTYGYKLNATNGGKYGEASLYIEVLESKDDGEDGSDDGTDEDDTDLSELPEIPGYPMIFIICVVALTGLILVKRNIRKN